MTYIRVGPTERAAPTVTGDWGGNAAGAALCAALAAQGIVIDQTTNGRYVAAVLATAGLVAFWRLTETSGTAAVDARAVQNGVYNLTGVTLGVVGPLSGDKDTVVTLDGTANASIALATNATLNLAAGPMTLECWIKTTQTTFGHIFGAYNAVSPYSGYGLSIGQTTAGALRWWDGANWVGGPVINSGGWHHIAVVLSGAVATFYVDGAAIAPTFATAVGSSFTGQRAIGARADLALNLNGSLGEVALYNVALSAATIATHWGAR